jgi:hypothetical protein
MNVFPSRWGYHPCDYETYGLLKKLSAFFHRARRRLAEWKRWNRKMPHNRLIRRTIRDAVGRKVASEIIGFRPEPPLDPLFTSRERVIRHGNGDQPSIERISLNYTDLPDAYRSARSPQPKPELVEPLRYTPEEIRRLVAEAEAWQVREQ